MPCSVSQRLLRHTPIFLFSMCGIIIAQNSNRSSIVHISFQTPPVKEEQRWSLQINANDSTIHLQLRPKTDEGRHFGDIIALGHNKSESNLRRLVDYRELVASINSSIDPCDDFYLHVCDGWIRSHKIGDFETRISQFEIINERVRRQINGRTKMPYPDPYGGNQKTSNMLTKSVTFFEIIERRTQRSDFDHLFYDFYDRCMNRSDRNFMKSTPLLKMLLHLKNEENITDLTDWMIATSPIMFWYSIDVVPDMMNTSRNLIQISPVGTYIPKEYYAAGQFPAYLASFEQFLSDVLSILISDDNSPTSYFAKGIKEIVPRVKAFIEIETRIAQVLNDSNKHRDNLLASYNVFSIDELQNLSQSTNWTKYMENIVPQKVQQILPVSQMRFNIEDLDSFADCEKLLHESDATQLQYYRDWKVILNYITYLDERYDQAKQRFDMASLGIPEQIPRNLQCQTQMTNFFPDLVGRAFISEHFDKSNRAELMEVFERVKKAFESGLFEIDWMDDETRRAAIEKLHEMQDIIGYNDNIFDEQRTKRRYSTLKLNSSMHYIEIMGEISRWGQLNNFGKLLLTNTKADFDFAATDVNAYYDPANNQIALLAGILQGAFFNTTLPRSMNYGAIGVVIGHEITHGFDDGGRQYDASGNLFNWWNNSTETAFIREKQCLIEQYGRVIVPDTNGMTIDGDATQGENIADNGGLRAAYKVCTYEVVGEQQVEQVQALIAYLNDTTASVEPGIIGLEHLSPQQLFFVSHAYSWCSKSRPESASDRLLGDSHTPDELRSNLALRNQPEFARAFKCAPGSPMNPTTKCRVW